MTVSGQTENPLETIESLRTVCVDRVIACLAFIEAIALPIILQQALTSGWRPLYIGHTVFGGLILTLWATHKRLPLAVRFWALIALMWGVGNVAVFSFGTLGVGTYWLMICALLGGMTISVRTGFALSAAALITIGLAAIGFISGKLTISLDLQTYMASYAAWLGYIIAAVCLPLIVFTSYYQQSWLTTQMAEEILSNRAELQKIADTDSLTGAFRLHALEHHLARNLELSQRSQKHVGVIFMDLDKFKPINDTHGHAVGDAVLKEIVARTRKALRNEDIIARIGGDEFVIVLRDVDSALDARLVAEKVRDFLTQPFFHNGIQVSIAISMGAITGSHRDATANQLLQMSDQLMYEAKASGNNQIRHASVSDLIPGRRSWVKAVSLDAHRKE